MRLFHLHSFFVCLCVALVFSNAKTWADVFEVQHSVLEAETMTKLMATTTTATANTTHHLQRKRWMPSKSQLNKTLWIFLCIFFAQTMRILYTPNATFNVSNNYDESKFAVHLVDSFKFIFLGRCHAHHRNQISAFKIILSESLICV